MRVEVLWQIWWECRDIYLVAYRSPRRRGTSIPTNSSVLSVPRYARYRGRVRTPEPSLTNSGKETAIFLDKRHQTFSGCSALDDIWLRR